MKWFSTFLVLMTLHLRAEVRITPVSASPSAKVLATIGNEQVRVSFRETTRAGLASARPEVQVRSAEGWTPVEVDPSAESYQVVSSPGTVQMQIPIRGFYPRWPDAAKKGSQGPRVIWDAGRGFEGIVSSVEQVGPQQLKLRFHPLPMGSLEAVWSLAPGEKSIRVSLAFMPKEKGQFSLGYFLFNRKPLDQVDELLMPMLVNAKRFPTDNYTLLQTQCPTPMSLRLHPCSSWARARR